MAKKGQKFQRYTDEEKAKIISEYLEGKEISIFGQAVKTIDNSHQTFIFDSIFYDKNGKQIENQQYGYNNNNVAETVDDYIEKSLEGAYQYSQENPQEKESIEAQDKELAKTEKYEKRQTKHIKSKVKGEKGKDITYNQYAIEEYVINGSKDKRGHKITRFEKIPEIREKALSERTKEEQNLLEEFNDMIENVIKSGVEYGVDPNAIIAIIQQEVAYDGTGDERKVTGKNGNGYMQITSAPVRDYLGQIKKNLYDDSTKDFVFGPEMKELLISRGFDPDKCPPEKKGQLAEDIMAYLRDNKDYEFNIRMGALILRTKLNSSNGNEKEAFKNYNGHPKNKLAYSGAVNKNYNTLKKNEKQMPT